MAFFLINANTTFPNPPTPQPISAGTVYEATAKFTVPTGQANASVVQMIPIPARGRVVGVSAAAVGSAATFSVGDGDDDDRYITSGAVAAGAVARTNVATAFGYSYTTADTLDVKFGATPTAGGIVYLTIHYVIE